MTTPLPVMTDLTAEFYSRLAAGALHFQRCTACGAFRHLPRYLCPSCHADGYAWVASTGEGQVFSWTVTMRALHPAFPGVPMTLVTVTMAEGPRVLGRLEGVAPEAMRTGLPVRLVPMAVAENIALPAFAPLPPWTTLSAAASRFESTLAQRQHVRESAT